MAAATRRKAPARRTRTHALPAGNPWLDVGDHGRGLHIGHFLTFQIIRLANAIKSNVTRQYLSDFGLSVPEWRLLAMTMRFEPVRFSELVANSSMDKGQASRTLQTMTGKGLIATRATRGTRRTSDAVSPVILSVTPKGRKLYQQVLPVAQRNQARLLHMLSRDERKVLYSVLNKLFAAIGSQDKLT